MEYERSVCCAFTGHRPEKLGLPLEPIKLEMVEAVKRAVKDGYRVFFSGMARGIDMLAADIVLRLRDLGEPVRLVAAVPFPGFEIGWSADWQKRYRELLERADEVVYVSPSYSKSCFQVRNEWMIDRSTRLIAAYNGTKGGTRNTVEYAKRRGILVVNTAKDLAGSQ